MPAPLQYMQLLAEDTLIQLLPEKALFLPEHSLMVIADLHLGKAMHFRKAGLFLPARSALKDYEVLHTLLQQYRPREVWFLGDLFHSDPNAEWQSFAGFIREYAEIHFSLVRGNHDILPPAYYEQVQIQMIPETATLGQLIFSHEPLEQVADGMLNIAGHLHPGCVLRGLGRQSMRLPCFYWNGSLLLLPAFGALTGLKVMGQDKGARIFAIAPGGIVALGN